MCHHWFKGGRVILSSQLHHNKCIEHFPRNKEVVNKVKFPHYSFPSQKQGMKPSYIAIRKVLTGGNLVVFFFISRYKMILIIFVFLLKFLIMYQVLPIFDDKVQIHTWRYRFLHLAIHEIFSYFNGRLDCTNFSTGVTTFILYMQKKWQKNTDTFKWSKSTCFLVVVFWIDFVFWCTSGLFDVLFDYYWVFWNILNVGNIRNSMEIWGFNLL
jgi:hypothetical protein